MPDTDVPVIEKWVNHLAELIGRPDRETFFVGHSIGCQAILRYLETITEPIGGAVFVAGWFSLQHLEDEETETIARPWLTRPIDLGQVKRVLTQSELIISDNDPYGEFEKNQEQFNKLGSVVTVLHGAGHITEDDGYTELPEALFALEKMGVET